MAAAVSCLYRLSPTALLRRLTAPSGDERAMVAAGRIQARSSYVRCQQAGQQTPLPGHRVLLPSKCTGPAMRLQTAVDQTLIRGLVTRIGGRRARGTDITTRPEALALKTR
jgi:hypothetical protein